MADRLEAMYRLFGWRIRSHTPAWDWEQIRSEVERWEDWLPVWCRWAERHAAHGDEQLALGRGLTAGSSYVRAGLYYHWASFLSIDDTGQFRAALDGMEEAWRRAAPLVDPPMELVAVPFEGTALPGYLRKPAGVERPPIAVLVPGADSNKEELYDLADHIVRRGVATFAFDGPGHGKVSFELKLRPDFEVPIRAVVDDLARRGDLDMERLCVGGISYGGMFSCRAAATDDRVKAAFSVTSWYSPAGRWPGMEDVSRIGLKQYMGENAEDVQNSMTLAGLADRITVPLLQIYGKLDPASPPSHAERTAAEAQGPTTTVVYDDAVHVANNVHYKSRPLVADWVAEQLGAAAQRGR
jgi:dienelactone hydrolase